MACLPGCTGEAWRVHEGATQRECGGRQTGAHLQHPIRERPHLPMHVRIALRLVPHPIEGVLAVRHGHAAPTAVQLPVVAQQQAVHGLDAQGVQHPGLQLKAQERALADRHAERCPWPRHGPQGALQRLTKGEGTSGEVWSDDNNLDAKERSNTMNPRPQTLGASRSGRGAHGWKQGAEGRQRGAFQERFALTTIVVCRQQTKRSSPPSSTPSYHTIIPHHHTTPSYHTITPHHHTTPSYHTIIPHHHTTPSYHTVAPYHTIIPHHHTTPSYHTIIPHHHTTPSHHTITPHHHTTPSYHTIIPHHHTTPSYHTVAPYHTIIPHHHTPIIPLHRTTPSYYTIVLHYHTTPSYHTTILHHHNKPSYSPIIQHNPCFVGIPPKSGEELDRSGRERVWLKVCPAHPLCGDVPSVTLRLGMNEHEASKRMPPTGTTQTVASNADDTTEISVQEPGATGSAVAQLGQNRGIAAHHGHSARQGADFTVNTTSNPPMMCCMGPNRRVRGSTQKPPNAATPHTPPRAQANSRQ